MQIQFEAVAKEFRPARPGGRGVTALAGVDLAIHGSGVRAVVGPNGAGKSTLFALLLGFLFPTSGHIRVNGQEPRRFLARHGAGYLPERFRLPPEWRVRAALLGLAGLEGLGAAEGRRRVDALLERLDLALHADRPLGALSRGFLQRVGLAQALLGERELIVLDEPTEGLDPLWRVRFRDIMAELRSGGRCVLIASHDLGEVERLSEEVVLLEAGRVREVFPVRAPAGGRVRYRLELAAPATAVSEAFPGAVPVADGRAAGDGATYRVEVADPAELSGRLAALLSAGATVVAVRPETEALEERVRRALGGPGEDA